MLNSAGLRGLDQSSELVHVFEMGGRREIDKHALRYFESLSKLGSEHPVPSQFVKPGLLDLLGGRRPQVF